MDTKTKIFTAIIIILVLFLIGMGIKSNIDQRKYKKEINEHKEMIVDNSVTVKEDDGQYAKLVDYFNSAREMNKQLAESNKDLSRQLRKNNEKLLQLSEIVASFENQKDTGYVAKVNDTTLEMSVFYPNKNDWFINWESQIDLAGQSYHGEWKFGDLNLQATLTETEEGLWNARLAGPDFLTVDSIIVNSLPPEEYVDNKERFFNLMVGGQYRYNILTQGHGFVLKGGVELFRNHIIIADIGTDATVGIGYVYKFAPPKK
jgi:uncharacterized membrane-anchored protein YhcB (DUF1043 family)